MKPSRESSAVMAVIRRWMPELRRAAAANGQGPDVLLDRALRSGLPNAGAIDLPRMLADAEASGFEPVGDLDRWQAGRESELRKRLSKETP